MTYTEIIDNIQTRIENLISERFTGTYFNIKIEPSNYNPDIDDTITVTITVTDQNDDPIPNWTVPLTINGTAITGTLTTNANGVATYNYTCSEWGVCRFSVKSCSTQINVTGLKQVKQRSYTGTNQGVVYTLFVDESNKHCTLTISSNGTSCGSGSSNYEDTAWIPSTYRPTQNKYTRLMRSNTFLFYAWSNGTIGIANFGSSATGQSFSGQVDWHY